MLQVRGKLHAPARIRRLSVLIVSVAAVVATIFVANNRIAADRRPARTPPLQGDPVLGVASARVKAEVRPDALIFSGDHFPALELVRPALIEAKLGSCSLRTKFLDRDGRELAEPAGLGFYAAIVEIAPAE